MGEAKSLQDQLVGWVGDDGEMRGSKEEVPAPGWSPWGDAGGIFQDGDPVLCGPESHLYPKWVIVSAVPPLQESSTHTGPPGL